VILTAMALMTVGTALASRVGGPWQFIALYGVVIAVGYTGCGILPVSVHVSRWFPGERGFVSAVAASGFSLGQVTLTQVAARAAAQMGWRDTYVLLAAVLGAALVLFHFTLRDAPATAAERDPTGDAPRHGPPTQSPAGGVRPLDRRAALGTVAFWGLTVGLMGCGFTDFLMTTHLAAYGPTSAWRPPCGQRPPSWAPPTSSASSSRVGNPHRNPAGAGLTYALRAAALFYLRSSASRQLTRSLRCSGRRSSPRRHCPRRWSANSSGPHTTARSSARRTSSTTARAPSARTPANCVRPDGQLPANLLWPRS
jgi:hypothetical protein